MSTELDYMEYANDAAAQAAYVSNGITSGTTIAYDTKTTAAQNPASSLTWSHTCSGDNRILFVCAQNNSSGLNHISGITYNGVALTKINEIVGGLPGVLSLWYLINPPTGAHNIVITAVNGTWALMGIGISYTGVAQTQPNIISGAVSGSANGVSSYSRTVTTTVNNSWALLWTENNAGTPSAGADTTLLQGPFGWSGACGLFYNTNPISPAGNFTGNYNLPTGNTVAVMVYFEPAVAATNLQCYSEATIKTQGSYALKGISVITDSLNKTLTRTIGSPVNLTGKTQIKFAIRASRTGSNIKVGIHDSGGVTTETTPNILSANTYQTVTWDISAVADADKDAIDKIIITIVNADANNTFYIDNMFGDTIGGNFFLMF